MAGIYIHVPFCKTRCIYCDFFTQTDTSLRSEYIKAIAGEIILRKGYLDSEIIHTIYFGGGTPSQLSKTDFEYIFDAISNNFCIADDAEITLEANPDDLDDNYLAMLQTLPFNRISIGIQSFNDAELKYLKRRHSAQRAKDVVLQAQKLGFNNISIDLMYGLPNQSMDIWKQNLEEAIQLNVQHISAYHLIYEKDTKLYKLLQQGKVNVVDEDISVDMFSTMIDKLGDAGFTHYEISNFSKDGLYSKHNTSYWIGQKYLGLGPAAHSFDGKDRALNISSIPQYIKGITNKKPNIEIELLEINTQYNDFIITGMRTMWGIDLKILESRFGKKLLNYCLNNANPHIDRGNVIRTENILKLTKQGIFISDGIMSDLMYID